MEEENTQVALETAEAATSAETVTTEDNATDYVIDESVIPTEETTSTDAEYQWVLDKYKDTDALAKSYAELNKKLSDKNMLSPEEASGYELSVEEGSPFTDEVLNETREFFKEIDLPAKYAQPLVEQYQKRISEVMETVQKKIEEGTVSDFTAETASTTLKESWGDAFDNNVKAANRAIKNYYDGDISEHLELANNPVFAEIMAKVGAELGEDIAPRSQAVKSNLSADEVDQLMASPEYWDQNSNTYKKVQQYFAQLDN